MPKQHIRQPGMLLLRHLEQVVAVRNGRKPSARKIALRAGIGNRFAVSHVVIRNHEIAKAIEVAGKFVIPLHILGNAVDDLKHRFRGALRCPYAGVDLARTAGIVVQVAAHPVTRPHRSRHP